MKDYQSLSHAPGDCERDQHAAARIWPMAKLRHFLEDGGLDKVEARVLRWMITQ